MDRSYFTLRERYISSITIFFYDLEWNWPRKDFHIDASLWWEWFHSLIPFIDAWWKRMIRPYQIVVVVILSLIHDFNIQNIQSSISLEWNWDFWCGSDLHFFPYLIEICNGPISDLRVNKVYRRLETSDLNPHDVLFSALLARIYSRCTGWRCRSLD